MICVTVVFCVVLLTGKGITVKYDKTFQIDDLRTKNTVDPKIIELLEQKLNKTENKTPDTIEYEGSMDSVIATVQDLFGPVRQENDKR